MKNQRAELSTQQIVLMIILIASFLVIFFFLLRLGIGEKSEEQLCYNSVLQKSLFPKTSLQCYRNYICITKDGSCEELIKPEKIKVKSLNETYKILAEEMAKCWWTFGEGKVDYVGKDYFFKDKYCSICSQIYFDDSLENLEGVEDKKISKDELYDYLIKNDYSKDQTYSQYLLGTNDLGGLKKQIIENENNAEKIGTFGEIEIGKQYFNVMGIISERTNAVEIGIGVGVGVAGVVVALTPVGWVGGAIIVVGSAALGGGAGIGVSEIAALTTGGQGIDNEFMAPTLVEAESDKFKALNCYEILTYT